MTSYWPTAAVTQHLNGYQRVEIANAQLHPVSLLTMGACHAATSKIPACTSLAFIQAEGAGMRRVYLSYPSFEQWAALERGGFVEIWDDFGFVMDALH
jgi:hypothetical protein